MKTTIRKGEVKMVKKISNYSDEEYAKIDQELEKEERKLKPNSLPGESTMLAYVLLVGIILVAILLIVVIF